MASLIIFGGRSTLRRAGLSEVERRGKSAALVTYWRGASQSVSSASTISLVVHAVSSRKVALAANDIYKICALLSEKEDTLSLRSEAAFLAAIAAQRAQLDEEALSPFQASVVDSALATLGASTGKGLGDSSTQVPSNGCTQTQENGEGSHSPSQSPLGAGALAVERGTMATTSSKALPTLGEPSISDRLSSIWEVVREAKQTGFVGTDDVKKLAQHCRELEARLRLLDVGQVGQLAKSLGAVNYQDCNFTALLSRRCCELASKFTPKELCRVYFNLAKLSSHDSLVAIVNKLEARVEQMDMEEVFLVAQALEKQQLTSAAPTRLVPKLAVRGIQVLPEVNTGAFHRALLVSMARYNLTRHPASIAILADVARRANMVTERDLLQILQAAGNLHISTAESGFTSLLKRAEDIVPTMDMRNIDALVDIVSVCNCDTTAIMNTILARVADDAGKLSLPQLVFLFEMLSGYPPAKGHAATASLAFAAALRSGSFDGESLEKLVLAMAQLDHFTDDFYAMAETLTRDRGGIRSVENLREVLRAMNPSVAQDPRGQSIISRSIFQLAPALMDEDIHNLRKDLVRLGVEDRTVHQKLFGRVKQLQKETGNRKPRGGWNSDPHSDF